MAYEKIVVDLTSAGSTIALAQADGRTGMIGRFSICASATSFN
jgi:hypothetical protein